jgi:hypothetical protein
VITNSGTINIGDAFSILLTYNPASFTHSGNSYVLTDASLALAFDGYSFTYTSKAGNYIEFSTPGVFGAGTVSLSHLFFTRRLQHRRFHQPLLRWKRYQPEHLGCAGERAFRRFWRQPFGI